MLARVTQSSRKGSEPMPDYRLLSVIFQYLDFWGLLVLIICLSYAAIMRKLKQTHDIGNQNKQP